MKTTVKLIRSVFLECCVLIPVIMRLTRMFGISFRFEILLILTLLVVSLSDSSSDGPHIDPTPAEGTWQVTQRRCGRSEPEPRAQFHLFTNESDPNDGKVISYGDSSSISESGYHPNGTWKVLIHGFLQHKDSFFPNSVKNAYIKRMTTHPNRKYNVLVVNWGNRNCSSIGLRVKELLNFNMYADCTTSVALQVAKVLVFLLQNRAIQSMRDVHIVGFSLGAHVAGQAGRNVTDLTGDKIARITGLDPAGPASPWWTIFQKHHIDLGPLDADFVDVIHTSGVFGTEGRMGHVDFYVNGGSSQPGCIPDLAERIITDFLQICSHNFAVDLFSKSILDNSVKGCSCGPNTSWNYVKYLVGWCTCEDQAVLGEFINPRFSAGVYFVNPPKEELNWRKYMKTLNESELNRSDSRILAIMEVLCLV